MIYATRCMYIHQARSIIMRIASTIIIILIASKIRVKMLCSTE